MKLWQANAKRGLVVTAFLLTVTAAMAQTWDDWQYRRPIAIDNMANPTALTDHQVLVTLAPANFDFMLAQPQGADIRFTDTDGETRLDHWIETWDTGSGTASIWVEVPEIPAAASKTIYMYYSNPLAPQGSDGSATFVFFDSFEQFGGSMNAPSYLAVPTYEGSGQVVHPDVVYVPGGWNGYEYWLGVTPYPNGNATYENPSIFASHDGLAWEVPAGLTNPLAPTPPCGGDNSASDLMLVDGAMLYHFNEGDVCADDTTHTMRTTSLDGVTWTEPERLFSFPRATMGYTLSPAFIKDGGTWQVWYVRSPTGCSGTSSAVYMRTSSDGLTWGPEQAVSLDQPGRVLWHLDVQKVEDRFVMLFTSYPGGSTCAATALYYAESPDGLNWTVAPSPLLSPNSGSWDSGNIFRSTFLMSGTYLRIWYSAMSTSGQWRMGYTEGELADFFAAQPQWDEIAGAVSATADHPRTGSKGLKLTGGATYPRVKHTIDARYCFTVWLYDELATPLDFLAAARVGEPTLAQAIGAGILTNTSTTRYIYHGPSFQYAATTLPRTLGWHQLSIRMLATACDVLVDGQLVVTLTGLDEDNLTRVSLDGYKAPGVGWFDDAYLRRCTEPEPQTTVGSEEVVAIEGGGEDGQAVPEALPEAVRLAQNYPNPLNPETVIRFALPSAGSVRLDILDLQGRLVRTLVAGRRDAGVHEVRWDGCDERGLNAASGTYLYRLTTPTRIQSRKLMLVR